MLRILSRKIIEQGKETALTNEAKLHFEAFARQNAARALDVMSGGDKTSRTLLDEVDVNAELKAYFEQEESRPHERLASEKTKQIFTQACLEVNTFMLQSEGKISLLNAVQAASLAKRMYNAYCTYKIETTGEKPSLATFIQDLNLDSKGGR